MGFALLLAQATPAAATPHTAPATAATPTPAGSTGAAPADPAADLDQLRQMYSDTCAAREYGAYDDICDQLRQQVREAERAAARAAHRPTRPGAAAPTSPP